MGAIAANAFAYADDIVLLTPSCNALRFLIKICELFAKEYKLKFNPDKCSLLIYAFNNSEFLYDNCNVMICGKIIKKVKSEKHLGNTFTVNGHSHLFNIDSVIRDLKIRTNAIVNNFKNISWQSKIKLFLSQCSALYGCQLWRLDEKQIEELDKAWRICCRRLLGLPPDTRSYILPNIMGTWPIRFTLMYRILTFFISGMNHCSSGISLLFKNVLTSGSSYMLQNINIILKEFDIKYCDLFGINKNIIRKQIIGKLEADDWRSVLVKELLMLREGQLTCDFHREERLLYALEPKEINMILKHVATSR